MARLEKLMHVNLSEGMAARPEDGEKAHHHRRRRRYNAVYHGKYRPNVNSIINAPRPSRRVAWQIVIIIDDDTLLFKAA